MPGGTSQSSRRSRFPWRPRARRSRRSPRRRSRPRRRTRRDASRVPICCPCRVRQRTSPGSSVDAAATRPRSGTRGSRRRRTRRHPPPPRRGGRSTDVTSVLRATDRGRESREPRSNKSKNPARRRVKAAMHRYQKDKRGKANVEVRSRCARVVRETTHALDVSLEAPSACAASQHESRVVVVSETAASASAPPSRAAAHGDARRRALARRSAREG